MVYFFFLLLLNDDCKLSQFLEQFNPSRHERGIIEIKDPQFVELSSTYDDFAKVVFFFTNDTTHGISYRSLLDSTSFYYNFVPICMSR